MQVKGGPNEYDAAFQYNPQTNSNGVGGFMQAFNDEQSFPSLGGGAFGKPQYSSNGDFERE